MAATSRAYGGVSAAERRRLRRAALIEAGLDIVGAPGHARLTVAGLAARAGLNERYVYENFANLDEVLIAIHDELIGQLAVHIASATEAAPDDAASKARAAIGAAVGVLTDDPRRAHFLFVEAPAAPVLSQRRGEAMRAFVALVVGQAQEFYGPRTALQLGSWGEFAASHLVGGFGETMAAWLRGDLAITRAELIERSAELFVAVAEHVVGGAATGAQRADRPG